MIGYLLENGVGELLQFCIVPFNFLQLTLKLKEKGEMELRQGAAYLCCSGYSSGKNGKQS